MDRIPLAIGRSINALSERFMTLAPRCERSVAQNSKPQHRIHIECGGILSPLTRLEKKDTADRAHACIATRRVVPTGKRSVSTNPLTDVRICSRLHMPQLVKANRMAGYPQRLPDPHTRSGLGRTVDSTNWADSGWPRSQDKAGLPNLAVSQSNRPPSLQKGRYYDRIGH